MTAEIVTRLAVRGPSSLCLFGSHPTAFLEKRASTKKTLTQISFGVRTQTFAKENTVKLSSFITLVLIKNNIKTLLIENNVINQELIDIGITFANYLLL